MLDSYVITLKRNLFWLSFRYWKRQKRGFELKHSPCTHRYLTKGIEDKLFYNMWTPSFTSKIEKDQESRGHWWRAPSEELRWCCKRPRGDGRDGLFSDPMFDQKFLLENFKMCFLQWSSQRMDELHLRKPDWHDSSPGKVWEQR